MAHKRRRQYGRACSACRQQHRACDGRRPCVPCLKTACRTLDVNYDVASSTAQTDNNNNTENDWQYVSRNIANFMQDKIIDIATAMCHDVEKRAPKAKRSKKDEIERLVGELELACESRNSSSPETATVAPHPLVLNPITSYVPISSTNTNGRIYDAQHSEDYDPLSSSPLALSPSLLSLSPPLLAHSVPSPPPPGLAVVPTQVLETINHRIHELTTTVAQLQYDQYALTRNINYKRQTKRCTQQQPSQHLTTYQQQQLQQQQQQQQQYLEQLLPECFPMQAPELHDFASFEGILHMPFVLRDAKKPVIITRPKRSAHSLRLASPAMSLEEMLLLDDFSLRRMFSTISTDIHVMLHHVQELVEITGGIEHMLGYSRNEMLALFQDKRPSVHLSFHCTPESDEATLLQLVPYIFGKSSNTVTDAKAINIWARHKDGSRIQVRTRGQGFYNDQGQMMFGIVVYEDVLQYLPPKATDQSGFAFAIDPMPSPLVLDQEEEEDDGDLTLPYCSGFLSQKSPLDIARMLH